MQDILRHWLFRRGFYRATLRGAVPTTLAEIDLGTGQGDAARGAIMAGGDLPFGGQRIAIASGVWSTDDPALRRHLHGFQWLDDIAANGDAEAWRRGRELVVSWLASENHWQSETWRADVLGSRLFRWLRHSRHLLTLDAGPSQAFLKSMAEQARHLVRVADEPTGQTGGFAAARGLLGAGLVIPGLTRARGRGQAALMAAIEHQVLADGGHISRSPAVQARALRQLIDIRAMLKAAGEPVTGSLQNAIDRMAPVLRLWRHGDGGLALFNGAIVDDAAELEALLADAVGPGRSIRNAPHLGFQRLKAGRTLLIVDAGAPAAAETTHAETTHAGTLSFEMSIGRDRLVVNCGATPTGDPRWRNVLRATGAHSTLVLDETASMALDGSGGTTPRRPRDVRAQRREIERNQLVEMRHDGYAASHGVIHHRDLYLAAGGDDVRGEDRLAGGDRPSPFAIRFHLHPGVRASAAESGSVLLRFGRSGGWRFRAAGADLRLEESIYFGDGSRRNTRQIVLDARHDGAETIVKWRFQKEN